MSAPSCRVVHCPRVVGIRRGGDASWSEPRDCGTHSRRARGMDNRCHRGTETRSPWMLLQRDAELASLERSCAAACRRGQPARPRGPGRHRQDHAARRAARPRTGRRMAVLRAGAARSNRTSGSASPASFAPSAVHRAGPSWASAPRPRRTRPFRRRPRPGQRRRAVRRRARPFQATANRPTRRPAVLGRRRALGRHPVAGWLVRPGRRVEMPLTWSWRCAAVSPSPTGDDGGLLGGAPHRRCDCARWAPAPPPDRPRRAARRRPGLRLRACHAATGGNPFLLTALLAHVAERVEPARTAAVDIRAGSRRPRVEQQLPGSPSAPPLARALAVLGRAATLRHAASFAGLGWSGRPR